MDKNLKDNATAHYNTVPQYRTYVREVVPGDLFKCVCCSIVIGNIYQHMAWQCPESVYYAWIREKCRLAYLYLTHRAFVYPETFTTAGGFVMFNGKLTKALMEKLPFDVLVRQDKHWNVLKPIMTENVVNGELRMAKKNFFDYLAEVMEEHSSLDDIKNYHLKMVPKRKFFNRLERLLKIPPKQVETDWNLDYSPNDVKFAFSNEEQVKMETTRAAVVAKYGTGLWLHCLPCETKADIIPQPGPGGGFAAAAGGGDPEFAGPFI